MITDQDRVQFYRESNGLLIKRAKAVAVAFFLFHLFTSLLDWVHLDLPFFESYLGKVPMVALCLAIFFFSHKRWMSEKIALYLCLLMLSLQLSVYIKSIQYNDYAPIASLVVFSCMFSAFFIPWNFRYHLVVTVGAIFLVSHWAFGFANATDWLNAARGTSTVAAVCIATAVLAYFNEGRRFLDWKEKQLLWRSHRMFQQLGEYTSDIVFIWNPDLSIDYVSPAFEYYTGRSTKDLLTTDLKVSDFVDADQLDDYMRGTREVCQGEERKMDLTLVHTDGRRFELEVVASPIFGSSGRVEKAIAVWRDITVRSAKERSLQQLANQDSLTRAYNQDHFQTLARAELDRAKLQNYLVTILYLDIDGYRMLTERYSLAAGDQVVIAVTDRCREVLGDETIIGRFGGDSILVLLSAVPVKETESLASKLIAQIEERPVLYEDSLIPVSVCIGFACADPDAQTSYEEILEASAKALYQAKRDGRGSYAFDGEKLAAVVAR